ncbi:MAG: hypothetical protein JST00_24785 [Deltaproteobacteria bacterium]|nr:hypothetical protein [Deltaproteobacteria bacterium]
MASLRLFLPLAALSLVACSGSARTGFENQQPEQPAPGNTPPPANTGDFDTNKNPPPPPPPEVNEVFGHSAATLYRLDPKSNDVTTVGDFSGCGPVIDIALDESSNLYATSYEALYTIDKKTAKCTEIGRGSFPNSLSFVPKGTVDAAEEALVGYEGSSYVRIDTKTGKKTTLGSIGSGLVSSGDIVSVKGGKTYLTVKGTSQCDAKDCLVEVDPKTGAMVKNWGSIGYDNVFGISFWGGKIYGFDETGTLFEVTFSGSSLSTKTIPIPSKPSNLSFWGAGSSTSAPLVSTPQ